MSEVWSLGHSSRSTKNRLQPVGAYFCPRRKTELFCLESSQTKATSVTGGGKLSLDRLGLVAHLRFPTLARPDPFKAPHFCCRGSGDARGSGEDCL